MVYENGALFILGGFYEEEFSKSPSRWIFSIGVLEFDYTKVNRMMRF